MWNALVWQVQINSKGNLLQTNRMPEFDSDFFKLIVWICANSCMQTGDYSLNSQAFLLLSLIKNKINRDVQSILSLWPCKSWQKTLKKTWKMYREVWPAGFLTKLRKQWEVKTYAAVGKRVLKYLLSFHNLWGLEQDYIPEVII